MKKKLLSNCANFTLFHSNDQRKANNYNASSFAQATTRIILVSLLIIAGVMATNAATFTTSSTYMVPVINPTITTISSNINLSNLGSNVVFTAIVKGNSNDYYSTNYFDGGTVTFMEGAVVLAADVPLVLTGTFTAIAGTATYATSSLTEGNHFITVVYNGHPTFATSSAIIFQTVVNPATCTTFTDNIAYVNASVAGGDNSGTSWANAFLTLEEAFDAARTCGVTQIWVAKGTYQPTDYPIGISTPGTLTDRNYTFDMVDGVAVYGGFSGNGTETNINQRNWASNQTILQGNNHFYNVVISINDGNATKLDGFTVTGGNADATTNFTFEDVLYYLSARNGAGLNTYNSSIEVDNCLFYGNNATGNGGAINLYKGSPSFNNIIVKTNTAFTGGGLASTSGSTIRNSVFSENIAGGGGGLYIGAVFYRSGEANTLINVVISKNQANRAGTSQTGGGILNNSSTVNYVNCTFYGNHAGSGTGGAQYNVNSCIITDKNSIYYGNSADGGYPDIRNYTPGGDLYTTTAVLFGNPLFVNEADPDGPDNIWMSNDDGLALQSSSPAINAGALAGAPTTDIRGLVRTGNPDQGAYEYGVFIQPSTTVVTTNLNPSCFSNSVIFTATVTSSGNPVTVGTVSFTDGIAILASNVSLNGIGQATFSTSSLTGGSHTILASYSGVPIFNPSSGSLSQLVNDPPTVNITGPGSICLCTANPKIYTAALDGLSEQTPNASSGTGTAIITVDNVLNTMRVQCMFSGLTSGVSASHIHSATVLSNTGTVGVATTTPTFTGFPTGVTSGTYDQTFDMTLASSYNAAFITANGGITASAFAALQAGLNANKAYYNIHTSVFPGGEIRGFLSSTCNGTTNLSPTTGGTWTSSNNAVATVSNDGVVSAVSEGTTSFTFTDATTNCSATTSLVTVNPRPDAVATPSSQAICSGSDITPIVNSGSVSGTVFNWTSDIVSSGVTGIAASGTGNISGSLVNSTNAAVTVTFIITPTANGCTGSTITAKVVVNPPTRISGNPTDKTIYALTNTAFGVTATGTPPVTYKWQVSTNGGGTYTNLSDGGVYSGSSTNSLSLTNVPFAMNGYKYQCFVTGGCSTETSESALLTVLKRPTTLAYGGDLTVQYTDLVHLTATLTDNLSGLGLDGKLVTFTIGSQSITGTTNPGGVATATLQITQAPGTYTVASSYAGDNTYATSNDSDSFTITQENACGDYTGPVFVNTSGATTFTTSVILSSVVTQEADGSLINLSPGSNINFAFNISSSDGNANLSLVGSPVYNASSSTFSQTANITIKTGQISSILDVSWTVNGNFTNGYCSDQRSVLTVAVPGNDFSAGGGYLILGQNTGGSLNGSPGTKNNFGYNIKWAKNVTKLTGNFNTIWKQNGVSYQAKSNSASALIISQIGTSPARYKAQITYSNVNMKQLDCLTNCWSDGNGTIIMTVYDWGEPGNNGSQAVDQIGFAVIDKNNYLIYSTNTYNTATKPDPIVVLNLNAGNIQVKTSTRLKIGEAVEYTPLTVEKTSSDLVMQVYPNPSKGEFKLALQLPENIDANAKIQLVNMIGKTVYTEDAEMGNGLLQKAISTPNSFPNGLYMVRVIVNNKVYKTQLIFSR